MRSDAHWSPHIVVCLVTEWSSEDHRPEEEHLQAGSGRVYSAGEDRECVCTQWTRGPSIRAWRQSAGTCPSCAAHDPPLFVLLTVVVFFSVRSLVWWPLWSPIPTSCRVLLKASGAKAPLKTSANARWGLPTDNLGSHYNTVTVSLQVYSSAQAPTNIWWRRQLVLVSRVCCKNLKDTVTRSVLLNS